MNIRHIDYFLVLAREKNFSKAAELLGITQPTLTQCIHKMESTLGAALFDRSFSSLRLTNEGEIFRDACLKIADIYKQASNEISEINNGVTGIVRIGIAPFRVPFTVSPVVNKFHKIYPNVHIHIEELSGEELTKCLDNGEVDIAVTASDTAIASKYESIFVVDEEVLIAVHEDIVKESETLRGYSTSDGVINAVMEDFRDFHFILLGSDQLLFRQFKKMKEKSGEEFSSFTTCTEVSNSLSLAECGAGAALIPSTGLAYYREKFPKLKFFSVGPDAPKRNVCVIYRKNQYLSSPVKAVTELLTDNIRN